MLLSIKMVKKVLFLIIMCVLFASVTTKVQAKENNEYTELTYDELLQELQSKHRSLHQKSYSSFDDIKIYAGLGYINALSTIKHNQSDIYRYQNGVQLSLGVDLFSRNWYAEGVFRNFGLTNYGFEELSLKEIDLKIGHQALISGAWFYTLGGGLTNRYLHYSDPLHKFSSDVSTPFITLSTGAFLQLNSNLSFGIEINTKAALVGRTIDKNSNDFTLRMTTSL